MLDRREIKVGDKVRLIWNPKPYFSDNSDARVKMSVIRNVLDNFIVLGSLDKKVSDSIINQIKQEI